MHIIYFALQQKSQSNHGFRWENIWGKKALVLYLRNECSTSYRDIAKKCLISKSSVERIYKESLRDQKLPTKRTKVGRPRKVNERSVRRLIRCLKQSRKKNINVTVKALVEESGLTLKMASRRTFSRRLNEEGYGFLQARKKGLLNDKDRKLRMKYARRIKRNCLLPNPNFWKNEVAFYLDGVSFVYKPNPLNSATSPKSRVWRKRSEGLQFTGKGSKELAGGRRLHILVAIAYGKGVVLKVPYRKMDGDFFAEFIRHYFNICFARCGPKQNGRRLFLMDNDPSQTSKAARKALDDIEAELHRIPARSPDLNPIENIFHLVKTSLEREAISLNITSETFEHFSARVLKTFDNLSVDLVDRTITSMANRVEAVIRSRGDRIKY